MTKRFTQAIGLLFIGLMIGGCGASQVSKLEPIIYTDNKGKILFYQEGSNDRPVTVMVQDRIVGVIKGNQYLEASVCDGNLPVRISTRVGDKMYEESIVVDVPSKTTLLVLADTATTVAQPKVINSTKDEIIKGKKEGTYVVNRSAPDCLRYIDISADVLFAFNSSTLTPKGKAELTKLANTLKAETVQVERMVIEGHTDRIGSVAYNNQLSLARANSVINYLKSQGITIPMTPRGMGKSVPVTDGCYGVAPGIKLHECLQPDRRVRIELVGKTQTAIRK